MSNYTKEKSFRSIVRDMWGKKILVRASVEFGYFKNCNYRSFRKVDFDKPVSGMVVGCRHCYTGMYDPGYGNMDYLGYDDYCPPYLNQEQAIGVVLFARDVHRKPEMTLIGDFEIVE